MRKTFTLALIVALFFFSVSGMIQSSLAAEPTPPGTENTGEGPLDGAESDPNPLYPALVGDQPQSPDWYQLPPSAFKPSTSNLPTSGVMQVVAGLGHTCALTTSGGVKCWGDNWEGRLGNGSIVDSPTPVDVVGLNSGVVAIASSHKHTCALTNTGGMKCWGRNWHGELGDNSTEYRVEPVDVTGLSSGVKAIAVGGFHTCALMEAGNIKCWGANWHGEVGDDTKIERYVPVDVVGLAGPAKAITAGKYHTCALLETGAVQCWGYNMFGQLGNNSQVDRPVPQDVYWLTANVQAITAGENHTCALTTVGQVLCWGNNADGELGTGNTEMQLIPVFTTDLGEGNLAIQAGMRFTCAITASNTVKCWGENWAGQLGDGGQLTQLTPVDVSGIPTSVTGLAAGDSHTCAVLATQGLMCWGSNSYGQIGNGETMVRNQPVDVVGLTNGILTIVSGGMHSCALTTEGAVKCWGSNRFGQLGNNSTIDSLTPVDVWGLDHDVTAIAAGGFHTCAAIHEEVRCWGYNGFGQLGDGSKANRITPETVMGISNAVSAITAGSYHTCALKGDTETIKCWGWNKNGQLGNGTKVDYSMAVSVEGVDGVRFSSLAAGDRHTCASSVNGNVFCWGYNAVGQLGDGTTENATLPVQVLNIYHEIASISAGDTHSCGLTFTGTVKCWGDNVYGELGVGNTYNSTTPVDTIGLGGTALGLTAGGFHTCAILADGSVQCWGLNQSGELGDGTTFMRTSPTYITSLTSPVSRISAGVTSTCAATSLGEAKCWGSNGNGQVGDGTIPWALTPVNVSDLFFPVVTINYTEGKPGSFFTISGQDLPGGVEVAVKANNIPLSPNTTTDLEGNFLFVLDTSLAQPGSYVISLLVGKGYNLSFRLDDNASYHGQEGSGVIYQIPGDIALTHSEYLPFGVK